MKKSDEEDKLSEQTLKTIEIVNIDDIKEEKANLDKNILSLNLRKTDLNRQEEELLKEQRRREERRKRSKGAGKWMRIMNLSTKKRIYLDLILGNLQTKDFNAKNKPIKWMPLFNLVKINKNEVG